MTFRMPAETDRHERTVMAWPARRELWGEHLDAAEDDYATVARVIARDEPVLLAAAPGSGAEAARACGAGVDVVEVPIDDSWARDTGPIVVRDDAGARVALDFVFDGWGGTFQPYDRDDAFAARIADELGISHRRVPFVFEGGAVTVDGAGAAVTTEQCLLHPNRGSRARGDVEATLCDALGLDRMVWLPFGLAEDDDTDGHVDNVAAFVRPGLVAVQGQADPGAPNHARLARGVAALRGAGIDVVELPVLPYARVGGMDVPVPYLNWYVTNASVVVPVTGHPYDEVALRRIGALFGRPAVGVPGAVLAFGGGGVHCITQQVPSGSS